MNTVSLSETTRATPHIKLTRRLVRSWIMAAMVVAFTYTVLMQPYFDLLSVGLIRVGRPQFIPILFYLKPVFMLALILIFYVRWLTPRVSIYFMALLVFFLVVLIAAVRGYTNFSEVVVMVVLLALAFRPVFTVGAKVRERLFRLYILNLAIVLLFGLLAYAVLDAAFWSDLNLGQVELYKSGAARSALTENFFGATFGARVVGFWGEPLAFGYSIIPLFMFCVVKYRQTGKVRFLLAVLLTSVGLLFSTRLSFGVSLFTAGFYWLYSYPSLRRYFPIAAIPFATGALLAAIAYLTYAYQFDSSTWDRLDSLTYFLAKVQPADLFGFSIGKFTNYDPRVGYQEAPEFGFFRFITGLGLPLALLVVTRYSVIIGKTLKLHRTPEVVMACSLMAYMLSLLIAPQFFTVKTLYPFAAVWFLVMADYE